VQRLARAEDHIKVLILCSGSTMRPQLARLEHGAQIGKINVNDFSTCVAVQSGIAREVLRRLSAAKLEGRGAKLRLLT
jgi:hypothetical protein